MGNEIRYTGTKYAFYIKEKFCSIQVFVNIHCQQIEESPQRNPKKQTEMSGRVGVREMGRI